MYMKSILISIFFLATINLFGQRQELLNKIADSSCECIEGKDLSSNFEMTLGLCILQSSSPLSDEIKEVLGIDLSDMGNLEKLGEEVGMTLATRCPSFMNTLLEQMGDEAEEEVEEIEEIEIEDADDPETWSDMQVVSEESPEYGGPENKFFITEPIADTNGSGLSKLSVSGAIKSVKTGLVNEVTINTESGNKKLYLDANVSGVEKIRKGAKLTLLYQEETRYNASKGADELVWIIIGVD